jgi:hypothetical protein
LVRFDTKTGYLDEALLAGVPRPSRCGDGLAELLAPRELEVLVAVRVQWHCGARWRASSAG